MIELREERMSNEFLKTHLIGLNVDAIIHEFSAPDVGLPHSHPYNFKSFIISGGYVEKVYHINEDGSWHTELIERLPGTSNTVEANHIHQIVELLEDKCYTIILPSEKVQESSFYKFGDIIEKRFWYESEFKPL